MHFCSVCDNVLHMQIGAVEDKKTTESTTIPLLLYCKHCPFTLEFDQSKDNTHTQVFNPCMYRSNYSSNHPLYFSTLVNKYTFDDPTLPRMQCSCPNTNCPTHSKTHDLSPEVIFVRYDDQEMQYLYLCQHCRQCWYKNKKNETVVLFDFSEKEETVSDKNTLVAQ